MGALVQAQLPALHAADGGGTLQLVMHLHAQAAPRLTEFSTHVGLPLSCVRLELPNLKHRRLLQSCDHNRPTISST